MGINVDGIRDLPRPSYLDCVTPESSFDHGSTHVVCYRINWHDDERVLNEWARHIRLHYERDDELVEDALRLGVSAESYLKNYRIPTSDGLGRSTRSGDFGEIVTSDLLQFMLKYEVPRYKQWLRLDRNQSGAGTDVVAYRFDASGDASKDTLLAVEVKTSSSTKNLVGTIEKAAADSLSKDPLRLGISVNYLAKQCRRCGDCRTEEELTRFLRISEKPCVTQFGASAVVGIGDIHAFLARTDSDLPELEEESLLLIVHREDLAGLIRELYDRCCK